MVKVRGRNSNGKTVKHTAENRHVRAFVTSWCHTGATSQSWQGHATESRYSWSAGISPRQVMTWCWHDDDCDRHLAHHRDKGVLWTTTPPCLMHYAIDRLPSLTWRTNLGKLHSKIISSDMKDFFPWNPMVKVRGRNSNGKTVKQTVKNGRKISGDDAARPAWVMVPGVSSSRLRPDSDQSRIWGRARPDSCVTHWMSSPGSALWYTHGHLTIFFFSVVSWVLFDKTVTEYRVWHKIHGTAEEVRCYPQIPGW